MEKPAILYLALLLHDTGKPEGHGNHSELSGRIALRVARRLGLDGATSRTLGLVIEHHLLMASVSQRRDLEDAAVIRKFAKLIQTPETLALLTLHTFVDSQATSDKLWNGFKDSLLWTLHLKTQQLLGGATEFLRAGEKQRELLLEEVKRQRPGGIGADELEAHFTTLPARYFQIHSARELVEDLQLVNAFLRRQFTQGQNPFAPVCSRQDQPDRGYTAVKICTWDRAGLFSKIAGSLSAAGLNILSAQIFTRGDDIALDTFFVIDARSGSLADPEQFDRFLDALEKSLTGLGFDLHALIARNKITRPLYVAYTGEHMPTHIRFDDDVSDSRTLIEVEAEDRVGLLYTISQTLTELALDVSGAKIATERGAAIDSFYVGEENGGKVSDPRRQQQIQNALRRAIAELEAK